ncbi:hypothetical protein FEP53_03703 [Burkholderia multivorans]|nr:hypothetical protein [Burkholderia multivorans]
MHERRAGRPAQPRGPRVVARGDARARARVARRRRIVMDGQRRRVHEPVAGRAEVQREQRFLAAEKIARMVSARAHERLAPEHRRAGQQAEDRAAGQRHRRFERARGHHAAGRVLALVRADQHARRERGHVRIRVEQIGRVAQRAGRPPRVVVAERDVGRARDRDAEIAAGRARIAGRRDERRVRKARMHERGRRRVGRVVDDDDRGPVRQRGEPRERARELVGAPVREHDRGHARLVRRQRDACGRYAYVTSHSSCQYVSGLRRSASICGSNSAI